MPYVPRQVPGFLQDFDALRKWTEEEFQNLARAYSDDELLNGGNLGTVQADVAALQTDVAALQTDVTSLQSDVTALQTQTAMADDIVSGSGSTALTTATSAQVATISVPAGTWDLDAAIQFTGGAATVVTNAQGSIALTTATVNSALPDSALWRNAGGVTDAFIHFCLGRKRITIGATTNYFLNARAVFTVAAFSATGIISARRVIT